MMNIRKRTEKKGIYNVLLCVALCGTTLCACKSGSDAEKVDLGSYTYGEEEHQCSGAAKEEPDGEDYLVPIVEGNRGFFSEMNGAWFVDDSDRFSYCETYDPPHEDCCSASWKIQLAEMKGTDVLAESVNRYHEEMYENSKTLMQECREAVTAMGTEDFAAHADGIRYCDHVYTLASFRWGNIFSVLDIEEMWDSGCTAVIANFNSVTGEKYEFADLFNTADYTERLTEILRRPHGYVADADEWNSILHSRFSFALTYRGLLLYDEGAEDVLTFAWKDIADILTPELISDVVRYSGWNNPYRRDTETWTGGHLYPVFEANQGQCAMRWYASDYHYIKAEASGEKETEEQWFLDDSDRFYYYEEYEPLHDGYGAGVWEIRLGEMKGDGKLAQAVNRYHEELYESRKAEMKAFQEEVTALSAEDLQEWDDFWKANANIFTMAAFRWGNLFTVVNMDYVGYKSCGIVPAASFNITTGEKYEIGDLFYTENYREELLEIIEKEAVRNEYFDWWDDDLQPGGFTYLISYHGLLIGETYGTRYVLVKWEDMRDILSPEFVSDVLVYADWNND